MAALRYESPPFRLRCADGRTLLYSRHRLRDACQTVEDFLEDNPDAGEMSVPFGSPIVDRFLWFCDTLEIDEGSDLVGLCEFASYAGMRKQTDEGPGCCLWDFQLMEAIYGILLGDYKWPPWPRAADPAEESEYYDFAKCIEFIRDCKDRLEA